MKYQEQNLQKQRKHVLDSVWDPSFIKKDPSIQNRYSLCSVLRRDINKKYYTKEHQISLWNIFDGSDPGMFSDTEDGKKYCIISINNSVYLVTQKYGSFVDPSHNTIFKIDDLDPKEDIIYLTKICDSKLVEVSNELNKFMLLQKRKFF